MVLEAWKSAIRAGNVAFSENRYTEAKAHYRAACRRADQLLLVWFDADEIVAALVVAYQNLANVYFQQTRIPEALAVYRALHHRLLRFRQHYAAKAEPRYLAECACRRIGTELLSTFKTMHLQSEAARRFVDEMACLPPLR